MRRFISPILIGLCLFWWLRFGIDIYRSDSVQSNHAKMWSVLASLGSEIGVETHAIRRPLHNKTMVFDVSVSSQEPEVFIAVSQIKNSQDQFVSISPICRFLLRAPPIIRV